MRLSYPYASKLISADTYKLQRANTSHPHTKLLSNLSNVFGETYGEDGRTDIHGDAIFCPLLCALCGNV